MLLRGMLLSFSNATMGLVPTMVPFQYNPSEVTRTFRPSTPAAGGPALRVQGPPSEGYSMKIELDGIDALQKPITSAMGVQPMIAAIEAMLEPAGDLGVAGALVGAVSAAVGISSQGSSIPAPTLPLVVLAWSPARTVPVRIDSLVVHETGFNAGLLPVQATVELGLTVLRESDLSRDLTMANALAGAYQAARSAMAITGVAQGVELML